MPTQNSKQAPAWTAKVITKATLDALQAFYSDPANIKAFEEWKAKRA